MEITDPGWSLVCRMRAGREEVAGAGRQFACLFGSEEWSRRLETGDFLVGHSLAIWSSIAEPVYGRGRAGDEGEVELLPLHLVFWGTFLLELFSSFCDEDECFRQSAFIQCRTHIQDGS